MAIGISSDWDGPSYESGPSEKDLQEVRRILKRYASTQWGEGTIWGSSTGISNRERELMKKFIERKV